MALVGVEMSMRRSLEWLLTREKKMAADRQKVADAWRAPVPEIVGNCELVKLDKSPKIKPVSATPLYPLVDLCKWANIEPPVPEYSFAKAIGRKWRFDYAWPLVKLACEVEGGLWVGGRHSRGKGAIADLEKYSEAAILGWRIVYATPQELENGIAIDRVMRALYEQVAA